MVESCFIFIRVLNALINSRYNVGVMYVRRPRLWKKLHAIKSSIYTSNHNAAGGNSSFVIFAWLATKRDSSSCVEIAHSKLSQTSLASSTLKKLSTHASLKHKLTDGNEPHDSRLSVSTTTHWSLITSTRYTCVSIRTYAMINKQGVLLKYNLLCEYWRFNLLIGQLSGSCMKVFA